MRVFRSIPPLLHTVVRTLLQALMYTLLASFVIDMATAAARRSSFTNAAHDAVMHFGANHPDPV